MDRKDHYSRLWLTVYTADCQEVERNKCVLRNLSVQQIPKRGQDN